MFKVVVIKATDIFFLHGHTRLTLCRHIGDRKHRWYSDQKQLLN